ncbi:hypothetical protein AN216_00745 [Streptomyces oceani]|uniref:HTH iclR-type domain-containing protein n=1 Tax=Streptomyces oceani TaxID=1075402 RepID=A0A1E7KQ39_9ACTN|nr:hypothetical protein AN216_00745 [Streptomyces oceani]
MGRSETASERTTARAARTARAGEVLDLVRRGRASTTSQIAQQMGLARSTVAERVELLRAHGLLEQGPDVGAGGGSGDSRDSGSGGSRDSAASGTARRGRPPSVLTFNPGAGLVLTAQLGMSAIRAAVTDLHGRILWSRFVDLDIGYGPDVVLARVEREFTRGLTALGASPARVHGISVGVPGTVELGTTQPPPSGPTRPWIDYPIAERLANLYPGPVFVEPDINLLALGEHRGAWPDAPVFVLLKVGTVIESGIVIGDRVARGAAGLAGEIGHTHVPGASAECACGNVGCLSAIASGGALARTLNDGGHAIGTAREVAEAANGGVLEARQAVREAGREIGEVLAGVINLLNPQVISIWGYLADAGDHLFAGVHESVYRYAVHAATRNLRIERSRLGDDASTRGAAAMVVERTLLPEAIDRYIQRAQDCEQVHEPG